MWGDYKGKNVTGETYRNSEDNYILIKFLLHNATWGYRLEDIAIAKEIQICTVRDDVYWINNVTILWLRD
jgi:hypothetical protein